MSAIHSYFRPAATNRSNPTRKRGWSCAIPRLRVGFWLACLAFSWLAADSASGDILILNSGGQVKGTIVNPDESPRKTYVIKTDAGQITLDKAQVKEVISQSADELQYERIRFTFADTVEEQWKLAEWCREKGLTRERTGHLERVIELDPNHKQARAALGFSKIDGRWNRREDALKERGFIEYKGKWMLPQDAEIQERKAKVQAAQKEWHIKLRQLRAQLDDRGPRAQTALAELKTLSDAAALPAIVDAFKSDNRASVKTLLIDALARIGTTEAARLLAEIALESGSEELRLTAVDHLKQSKNAAAVGYFVTALGGGDNAKVNRAGVALGELGEKSAIGPLIGALVSVQKARVQQGGSGSISPSFDSSGGIGFGVGGKSVVIQRNLQNRGVHEGLIKLTGGADFGYDVVAWRHWLNDQRKEAAVVPGRRD
jgi:hypothetical protein